MGTPALTKLRQATDRRDFTWFAALFALLAFAGFARTYYLKPLFHAPRLPALIHFHGVVMTGWVVLFLVQTRLVAARKVGLHRRIGLIGVWLTPLMLLVGVDASLIMARRDYRLGHGSTYPLSFLALQLVGLLVPFAIFIILAVTLRQRPAWHSRFMVLATLRLLPPATTRIPLAFIQKGGIPILVGIDVFAVLVCLVVDTARNRKVSPVFLWGGFLLVGADLGSIALSMTTGWIELAKRLIS
jgi:hypothetical protein